jgi:hypothetical protein
MSTPTHAPLLHPLHIYIQNMSMSYITFFIAVWWLYRPLPTDTTGHSSQPLLLSAPPRSLPYDLLWKRFPKFVIGYLSLSVIITVVVGVTDSTDFGDSLQVCSQYTRLHTRCIPCTHQVPPLTLPTLPTLPSPFPLPPPSLPSAGHDARGRLLAIFDGLCRHWYHF